MGEHPPRSDGSRLHGVLVTFQRPGPLRRALQLIAAQDRQLDRLIVVDNAPSEESAAIVRGYASEGHAVEYVPMRENVGFAGGVAEGMGRALQDARNEDWVVVFDDDDPPPSETVVGELERFALEMQTRDPRTAAVGLTGGWFDWRRGRFRRVPDRELHGPVPVDHVAGGHLPLYRVAAIRVVGPFYGPLFFGLSELEYGLRLTRAGYSIYAHGDLWLAARARHGRLNLTIRPGRRLPELTWRRYYSLRNAVFLLRTYGHPWVALRVALVHGLAKPLANLVVNPGAAVRHLALNWKACRDGWGGRMGRVVEPDARSRPRARDQSPR